MPTEISSYISPKLQVGSRHIKGGFGVFAAQFIQKGELLAVWGGRVVNGEELASLPLMMRQHSVQVEENLYLAPLGPSESADYFNHSCDPNAGLNGQIAIVAMRDIQPGEEVCIDYAMCDGSPYDEFECTCQSPNCRGRITGDDWRNPELWERYKGYFSPYLQRRIEQIKAKTGNLP